MNLHHPGAQSIRRRASLQDQRQKMQLHIVQDDEHCRMISSAEDDLQHQDLSPLLKNKLLMFVKLCSAEI